MINLILQIFLNTVFAKELSCSHYYHVNVHDVDTDIVQWQESFPLPVGENISFLQEKLKKNKLRVEEIKQLLKSGQKAKAKQILENELDIKFSPADSYEALTEKLGRTSKLEKDLIKFRENDYSTINFKYIANYEEAISSKDFEISEGVLMTVENKQTKVINSYFHGLNNSWGLATDKNSKKFNSFKLDLRPFHLTHPQFGKINFISYECVYPLKELSAEESRSEYLMGIEKLKSRIKSLDLKIKNNEKVIIIKEKNENYPTDSSETSTGATSK